MIKIIQPEKIRQCYLKKKQIPNHKKNKRSLHRQNIKMPLIFYRFKLQNIKKE